jgi:hypothetical protein
VSIINKDQDVVSNGRKGALKDVDADLRDQVVAKLYKQLIDKDIGQKVSELWTAGNANRAAWSEKMKVYLQSIDDHSVSDTSGPFEGSSRLHLPIPLIVCKTFHSRMYQALMGVDTPFYTKARNQASNDRVQTVSDTMRYYVYDGSNYGRGIDQVVDLWLWDWITTGVGLKKWRWDCRYERYIDVVEEMEPGVAKIVVQNGIEQAVPTMQTVEKEVTVTKKTFEGPVCDLVSPEDIRIVGGGGDPDLADAVLHRQFLTASELWTLADRKVFDIDAVKTVVAAGKDYEESAVGNEIKLQRKENSGQAKISGEEDLDRYEILEAYLAMDVDGSGINTNVVVWVHNRTRELLRATYLRRISPTGERPFVKADFQPRKDQEYAAGMIELIHPLAREMDAIHNMRLDFGMISVMPFGFYRASSGIDPATIQLEPGALIPVDNPQTDVFFPNLGNRTVFGMQEEAAIQQMIERVTNINDINLGMINGQGATRTATGSRLISGEMSSNLDVYLRRLNRAWKKSLRCLLHMLQHRIPEGMSFRLTGDDGKDYWRTVESTKELEGDFDIEVLPNSQSSNQQIQIEQAQQIIQVTSNPLYIQMGLVGAPEIYESLKNFFMAVGVRDFGRYLTKMDPNIAYAKLTPEQEANLVLHGIDVPVMPQMDHEGFLGWFQMAHDSDEILGQFNEEQTVRLARQAKQHEQMQQALKQMQAQQANSQQMRMNAALSAQQAPIAAPGQASVVGASGPTPGALQ